MDDRTVGQAWDDNAPEWVEFSRAGYDVYRDLVNTPAFLALLPDVAGQAGLDVGCGEGHNTRLVAERGAHMVGLDISAKFLDAARAELHAGRGVRYVRASARRLPFSGASYDFVTAFMSLMDMPDPDAVLGEVARVLRPGGFLQFSISHPCTNGPVRRWVTDAEGRRIALASGGYFDGVPWSERWLFGAAPPELRRGRRPFAIPRFPRTVSGWLNAVAAAGLVIEAAAEPVADEDTATRHPEVADTRIAPYFLLVRARRPRP